MSISDEELNHWAERFLDTQAGRLLNISFETYLTHPEYYDGLADALNCGHGLHLSEAGRMIEVEIGNKNEKCRMKN